MKKLLPVFFLLFLLASCRTELEYKGPEGDPALYVYALFDNDTLNYVFVGETSFFLDNPNTQCLDDAEVSVQVNRGETVNLAYDRDSALYVFDGHLKTGDTLRLTVTHPRLGSAEAVAVVPPEVTMTIKNVEYFVEGEMFDNHAIFEFVTDNLDATNSHYFHLNTFIDIEAYTDTFNQETFDFEKGWITTTCLCPNYIVGHSIVAERGKEEDLEIWNLIYGQGLEVEKFGMKGAVVECTIEFEAEQLKQFYDSLGTVTFYSDITVYSPEYVTFIEQSNKAKNESNNPFVEPTQVQGNVKPLGDKRVFGIFAVTRKSAASLCSDDLDVSMQ